MKRQICWIAALTLFWVAVTFGLELFGWQLLDGFSGLAIKFFLGYCALILVAQVYSALVALRSLLGEAIRRQAPSRQVLLRAEEQSISPEE
jgi:divalent metal cation (Fe/Co/Zn/Cd) transporter